MRQENQGRNSDKMTRESQLLCVHSLAHDFLPYLQLVSTVPSLSQKLALYFECGGELRKVKD